MDKLTPTHAQWRQRRAEEYGRGGGIDENTQVSAFLCGMEAEGEVMRLVGRAEAFKELWEKKGSKLACYKYQEAEYDLAALLTKGEG